MSLLALLAAGADPPDPVQPPELPASTIHSATPRGIDWPGAVTLVTKSQTPYTNATLREQDDIILDPGHPDPSRRWCFYFSVNGSSGSQVWVCHSPDGTTWSNPVLCTVAGDAFWGEDPSVTQTLTHVNPSAYRDGEGRLILYCENNFTSDIDAYTSTDGVAWTLLAAGVIARSGATSGWDHYLVGSPNARHDGTKFIIGYEGIQTDPGSSETFSVAWGADPAVLTKSPNTPVIDPNTLPGLSESIVVDAFWVTPDRTAIMLTAHSGRGDARTMWRMRTTNLDPTTWKQSDFTLIDAGGVIDPVRNDLTADLWHGRLVTAPADDLSLVSVALLP